jgi:hypothetical protein
LLDNGCFKKTRTGEGQKGEEGQWWPTEIGQKVKKKSSKITLKRLEAKTGNAKFENAKECTRSREC